MVAEHAAHDADRDEHPFGMPASQRASRQVASITATACTVACSKPTIKRQGEENPPDGHRAVPPRRPAMARQSSEDRCRALP